MAAGLGKDARVFCNRFGGAPSALRELIKPVSVTLVVEACARDRTLKSMRVLVARAPWATNTSPPFKSITMFWEFSISLVAASITRPPVKVTVLLPVGAAILPIVTPPGRPLLPAWSSSPRAITTMVPAPASPAPKLMLLPLDKSTVLPINIRLPPVTKDRETVR